MKDFYINIGIAICLGLVAVLALLLLGLAVVGACNSLFDLVIILTLIVLFIVLPSSLL